MKSLCLSSGSVRKPHRVLHRNLEDFKKPLESRRDGISVEKRQPHRSKPRRGGICITYEGKYVQPLHPNLHTYRLCHQM